MNSINLFFSVATQTRSLSNSLKISLIVGTILNLINQGDKILVGDLASVDPFKFVLTYMVPFMVSTYSSTVTKLSFLVGMMAEVSGEAKCTVCGSEQTMQAGQTVPLCSNCGKNRKWKLIKLFRNEN